MSKMTYLEAIEYVLGSEMEARDELIVFRPGARPALVEDERDIALPRLGTSSFSIAMGAALYGMHPVLDLRQEINAAAFLADALCALPAGTLPEMTVLLNADEKENLTDVQGVRVLAPVTPRQAAGFTRAALRSGRITVLAADQALYGMEDEVPGESDFMMLPLEEETGADEAQAAGTPEEAEMAADDAAGVLEDASDEWAGEQDELSDDPAAAADDGAEDAAADEPAAEEDDAADGPDDDGAEEADAAADDAEKSGEPCEQSKVMVCLPAMRSMPCSLKRLQDMAEELDAEAGLLIGRCMEHAAKRYGGFAWEHDRDALSGECAYLPAEDGASVWLGCDMLTVCYDPARIPHGHAALLLRGVRRLLEKPSLLIYDKEMDEK